MPVVDFDDDDDAYLLAQLEAMENAHDGGEDAPAPHELVSQQHVPLEHGHGAPGSSSHAAYHEDVSEEHLRSTLKSVFGFNAFSAARAAFSDPQVKKLDQLAVVRASLNLNDTLVVASTGAGKSLCFQLPPVATNSTALVISPLISLMVDQVRNLTVRHGIPAAFLGGAQTNAAQVERDAIQGKYRLVYVTPEKVAVWSHGIRAMQENGVLSLIAVDESHCVSEWGHDFRPSYQQLGQLRDGVLWPNPRVPIMALTATATPRVREDIVASLRLENPQTFLSSFDRRNLMYRVEQKRPSSNLEAQLDWVGNLHGSAGDASKGGSAGGDASATRPMTLVYVQSRREADDLAAAMRAVLKKHGADPFPLAILSRRWSTDGKHENDLAIHPRTAHAINARRRVEGKTPLAIEETPPCVMRLVTRDDPAAASMLKFLDASEIEARATYGVLAYHAQKPDGERQVVHDAFAGEHAKIVVATSAFGMGIDKANIRHVIHWGAPSSVEAYYQQSGRAGRDGLRGTCTLYYGFSDFALAQDRGAEVSGATGKAIHRDGAAAMRSFCTCVTCRRAVLLTHYTGVASETQKLRRNCCDVCEDALNAASGGAIGDSGSATTISPSAPYELGRYAAVLLYSLSTMCYGKSQPGAGRLLDLLLGSKSSQYTSPTGKQNFMYERCKSRGGYDIAKQYDRTRNWWQCLLERLSDEGFVNRVTEEMEVAGPGRGLTKPMTRAWTSFGLTPKGKQWLGSFTPSANSHVPPPPPSQSNAAPSNGGGGFYGGMAAASTSLSLKIPLGKALCELEREKVEQALKMENERKRALEKAEKAETATKARQEAETLMTGLTVEQRRVCRAVVYARANVARATHGTINAQDILSDAAVRSLVMGVDMPTTLAAFTAADGITKHQLDLYGTSLVQHVQESLLAQERAAATSLDATTVETAAGSGMDPDLLTHLHETARAVFLDAEREPASTDPADMELSPTEEDAFQRYFTAPFESIDSIATTNRPLLKNGRQGKELQAATAVQYILKGYVVHSAKGDVKVVKPTSAQLRAMLEAVNAPSVRQGPDNQLVPVAGWSAGPAAEACYSCLLDDARGMKAAGSSTRPKPPDRMSELMWLRERAKKQLNGVDPGFAMAKTVTLAILCGYCGTPQSAANVAGTGAKRARVVSEVDPNVFGIHRN